MRGILAGITVFGVASFRADATEAACDASRKTDSVAVGAHSAAEGTHPADCTALVSAGHLKDATTNGGAAIATDGAVTFTCTAGGSGPATGRVAGRASRDPHPHHTARHHERGGPQMPGWLAAPMCAVLGLIVGSFLSGAIARVPDGRSVVRPGSACPGCGHPIRPRDNVPVLSWLLPRGKRRDCGSPIPARYPLLEAGTSLLFAIAGWRFGFDTALPVLFLAALSGALSSIDLDTRRLPDRIALPAHPNAAGLRIIAVTQHGAWPLLRAAIGGAALAVFYLALWLATSGRGIGYGDVTLAGLVGGFTAYLGWGPLVVGGVGAFVLGALVGIALMAAGRAARRTALPFGPLMFTGA